MIASDFPRPFPVQFAGSALACWLRRRLGWRVHFEGLPAMQGVLAVYPHTGNWDFVILVIVKWALGVPVRFWGKDSLFRVPLGLVRLDYRLREVKVLNFIRLTGSEMDDFQRIAHIYAGVTGCKPVNAAPIRLLEPEVPRTEIIVK